MNYIYAYLTTNFLIQLKVDYNQNHLIFKIMMHISYAFNAAWIAVKLLSVHILFVSRITGDLTSFRL